jgi:hypothetical protein
VALQGCHLRIEQEVVFWAARKGHRVAGECGEFGEQGLKLSTGRPSSVTLLAALRRAAVERCAGATIAVRAAINAGCHTDLIRALATPCRLRQRSSLR